jgi:HTH-type transcriptional regulator/antitoxin HigA
MPNRKIKIENERTYNATMKKIDALMAAQAYEKSIYKIPAPKTLEGLIELKMYERKLKQKELARLLGVGEPKLSQIMSRKRKPDVAFLKAAHTHLGIDGNILLEFA